MKSKSFSWLWVIGIPLLVTLAAASPEGSNLLLTMALPFTWMGDVLRKLSLAGGIGHPASWGLYIMLCVSPLLLIRKGDGWKTNGMLVLASFVMFWVMWYLINPGMMPAHMRNEIGKALYAGAIYSVLTAWGVIKLLDSADRIIQARIYSALRIFLIVCAACFGINGLGFGLGDFRIQLNGIQEGNTALTDSQLMPTYLFLALDFTLTVLEHLMVAWILVMGVKLLYALEEDPYSEACCRITQDIFSWCRKAIPLVAGSNLLLNLGQVFLADILVNLNLVLHLPVASLGVTFAMMALTRLLGEGKAIKEDNDLFI